MKKISLLACLILSEINLVAQEITLKGQVSIHNSKYETGSITYVSNAYASAPFAGSDDTDELGKFGLTFTGIDGGTEVKVKVEKANLEIVNEYDLQQVIIGRKSLLRVYLTNKGKLANAQTELFNISKKNLYAKYNQTIEVLEKDGIEKEQIIADLNANLNLEIRGKNEAIHELKKQRDAVEKRLPEFAQELAAVNLDFASDLYIEAYEHFKKGAIEKAIKVLNDAKLDASYKNAMAAIKQAKAGITTLESAINAVSYTHLTLPTNREV